MVVIRFKPLKTEYLEHINSFTTPKYDDKHKNKIRNF